MKNFYIRLLALLLCVVSWSASLTISAQDAAQHTLSVVANPTIAGTFNTDNAELQAGETIRLLAYAKSNFSFIEWQDSEGNVIARTPEFEYTMPDHDVTLTATYEYNPANPENPVKNYWDAATGVAIVDDFKAGSLSSAVSTAIKGSKTTDLLSLTVAGQMTNNDYSVINSYANCAVFDISRVTGVTEVPSYAFDYTKVESVYLPASIEKMGYRAFYQCKQLTSLTVYAMVPPTIDSSVFSGIQEGLIVYVPAAAIAQYQDDANWQKFTILPVQDDVRNLTVSLPEGATAADFAQMWLELTNTKNGQKLHYVLTDRTSYTFANIIRNTSWNAVLRNQRGDVFGRIDGIEVKNEDVNVTFSQLSRPQNVSVAVMTPEGREVTTQAQITWVDAEGNYLAQSNSLSGLPAGYTASYRVALPQDLAMQFVTPEQTECVVNETNNRILCQLAPIPQVTLTGQVKDLTTKTALRNANVSASQTFGGRYSKTVSTKTDANGCYSLTISSVPTSLAVSAFDYISQTIVCDTMMTGAEMVNVPDVSLKGITGAVITLNLTYTKCPTGAEDEETFQEWYSDYNNVGYSIYNRTKQCAISQYNVQYPQIVLLEEVSEGDELELMATSKTGAFMPIVTTATIDAEQRANAAFNIVELGKIQATFVQNSNASVVGILYDAKGKLVKSYDYTNTSLTISNLADGSYTLVSMGGSPLFNSIYDLRQLPQTGLVRGSDYVQQSIEVKSGQVTNITIDNVPTLNESALYYTGDNTSFTVNKPSIVAGNYLTLTGNIDFKSAYKDVVSNVNLIVDLPESCSFVEGSVMVGNNTSSYTLQDNRVTIPLAQYTDRVRFCIIPTLGGDYAPSALCQFDIDGESITQPIGSANYQVKDLSINVPTTTAKTTIPISGTATGGSTVEIYDGDVLIGQTTALANGTWSATCELDEAYNLSTHEIYAKVTKGDLSLSTNHVDCKVFKDDIVVKTIKMTHFNEWKRANETICIDYQNQTTDKKSYDFYHTALFTFNVDFNRNDTTCIDNVVVLVWNTREEVTRLAASYSETTRNWVATGNFDSYNLPSSIDVDYDAYGVPRIIDRENVNANWKAIDMAAMEMKSELESINSIINDTTSYASIDEIHDRIDELLSLDDFDSNQFDTYLAQVVDTTLCYPFDRQELDSRINAFLEEYENIDDIIDLKSIVGGYMDISFLNYSSNMFEDIDGLAKMLVSEGVNNYLIEKITSVDKNLLLSEGYLSFSCSDSSFIYYRYDDDNIVIIDPIKGVKISVGNIIESSKKSVASKLPDIPFIIDPSEWAKCVNLMKTAIDEIRRIKNGHPLDIKSIIKEYSQLLKELGDGTSCFYYTCYGQLELKLKECLEKKIGDINKELSDNISLKNDLTSRINNSNNEIKKLRKANDKLDSIEDAQRIKENNKRIDEIKRTLKNDNKNLAKIEKAIVRQNNKIEGAKINYENQLAHLRKLPKNLEKGARLSKTVSTIGKLAGPLGVLIEGYCLYLDIEDAKEELQNWQELLEAIERRRPCENDRKNLETIYEDCKEDNVRVSDWIASTILAEGGAILADIVSLAPGQNGWFLLGEWLVSGVANGYSEIIKNFIIYGNFLNKNTGYVEKRGKYYDRLRELKCFCECDINGKGCKCPKGTCICKRCCNKCKCQSGGKCTCKGSCKCKSKEPKLNPSIDPSGFVYEGVFSNRLSGVTATCYYKEMVEDMYGDLHENIVKWNAEEYAQENPLFTDENGFYRWDVPQGLWQVKFEKEGYETTYSEWLPVPPPQLDVNIAMTQVRQPEVKSARAYEDAVEVEFDKYMIPATLTEDNIYVTANGKKVEGTILLLNEEVAYEGKAEKYASKIRFNANAPFAAKEVTLTVANRVKSYAGIQMQESFSQTFDVEQEVKSIETEANITVTYDGDYLLTVKAMPAAAAAGKTLIVRSSSSMIATTDTESYILDKMGEAQVLISGELPGTTGITFTIDGYDLSVTTMVNVQMPVATDVTATPTASIASGTTVERGTKLTLSCETPDATIYYTLDGSCPCDEDTRLVYTAPIVINESVTIKAMAVAPDMEESQIAEYVYIVTKPTGVDEVTLDETIKVYPLPVRDKLNVTAGGELIKSVTLVSTNGCVVAKAAKPETIVTLDVSILAPGIYFINVATEDKNYSRKIMKVE